MANFFTLFSRYLVEKSKGARLDWDKIEELRQNDVPLYFLQLDLICHIAE